MSHLYSNKLCSACGNVGDALVFEDGFVCVPCNDRATVDAYTQWHDDVIRKRDAIANRDNRLDLSALNYFDPSEG